MTRLEELNEAWCKQMNKCSTEIMQALAFALRWCEEHPQWISVEDELPPLNQEVLICEKEGILGCDTFLVDARQEDYYNNSGTNNGWEWRSELDPTHWMPLPQAPKGGGRSAQSQLKDWMRL